MANLDSNPGFHVQFSGADLRIAHLPIVYVWKRRDEVMYVGSSTIGIARVFADHHRLCYAVRPEDTILVFHTADVRATERRWIAELKPLLNRRKIDIEMSRRLLRGDA